jgi:hypothetical protein
MIAGTVFHAHALFLDSLAWAGSRDLLVENLAVRATVQYAYSSRIQPHTSFFGWSQKT